MQVDIYSDVVCPWCYVGLKRFASARAQRPAVPTEVRWLPFELNPDIDSHGVDRDAYLAAKFGDLARIEGMQDHLRGIGAKLGIEFRFDLIRKTPNTRAAHALLALAAEHGLQNELSEALFAAYFEQGRDVGDTQVLIDVGARHGLEVRETRAALAERRHYAEIIDYEQQAMSWGISGVPTFIFDHRYAISGAQEPQVLLQIFDRLREAA